MTAPRRRACDRGGQSRPAAAGRRTLLLSVAVLALLYALVIGFGDARAWSGSDAGGKVATVRVMAEQHRWVPDVGYWAERWDTAGVHHPLLYTSHIDDKWVQVTSLPLVYAGVPLWRLGGARALLVLPALGAILAALAARSVARALGGSGTAAFWLVGALSPMSFYAADFWEHSIAVGLTLAAVAIVFGPVTPRRACAAGALLGLGAVMRTEVLVYAAVLALAVLLVADERRRWLARPLAMATGAVTAIAVLGANSIVERIVLGTGVRDTRAANAVADAGADAGSRLHDAAVTTLGLFGGTDRDALLRAAVLVVGLAVLAVLVAHRDRVGSAPAITAVVSALVLMLYVLRASDADPVLGFVPGMVAAVPLSILGVVAARTPRARLLAGAALGALPLVWFLSWRGQLVAQWGGRYLLISGALLLTVASVELERRWRAPAAVVLVACTVIVSGIGVAWHVQRTRGVARAVAAIERVPDDTVIVSTLAHLGREGGWWYSRHRWLNADAPGGLAATAEIARSAGAHRVDVVELVDDPSRAEPATFAGYTRTGSRTVSFLGFPLRITTFTR